MPPEQDVLLPLTHLIGANYLNNILRLRPIWNWANPFGLTIRVISLAKFDTKLVDAYPQSRTTWEDLDRCGKDDKSTLYSM